jgi:O-succinylbenzoate synthase
MEISAFDIFRYRLPFKQRLMVRGEALEQREGLILQITDSQNSIGLGEIAPLPGASRESLAQAQKQLQTLLPKLVGRPWPQEMEKLEGHLTSWLDAQDLYPSVRYGIEMALLNAKAFRRHAVLSTLLNGPHESTVGVNALLQGEMVEVLKQIPMLLADGYRTFKLKVGSGRDLDEDVRKVIAVSKALEEKALLRLDGNRSWKLDEAVAFVQAVGLSCVEYIEEPLQDISQIPDFYHATYLPVALDETLQDNKDLNRIKAVEGVDVLILKPTLLGGFELTWQLIQEARCYGLRTIVSSSFESGVGISALTHFAACCTPHDAAGLDTIRCFAHDLLRQPSTVFKGRIVLGNEPMGPDLLKADLLESVG